MPDVPYSDGADRLQKPPAAPPSVDLVGTLPSSPATPKQESAVPDVDLIGDLNRSIGSFEAEAAGTFGLSRRDASAMDPARASEVLNLSIKSGLPDDMVERNFDEIKAETDRADFDRKLLMNSPKLAKWLTASAPRMAATVADAQKWGRLETLVRRPPHLWPKSDDVLVKENDEIHGANIGQPPIEEAGAAAPLLFAPGAQEQMMADPRTIKAMDLASRRREEAFISGDAPVGPLDAIGNRFNENPIFFLPFVSTVPDAVKAVKIYESAKALETGTATPQQMDFLVRAGRMEEAARMRGTSTLGKVGGILAELPAFAGEFAATGGIYAAGKGAAVKVTEGAAKVWIGGILKKALAVAVGTAAQTAVMAPLRIATETVQRMTPTVQLNPQEEEQVKPVITATGDGFEAAFAKAAGSAFIETLSERSGVLFEKATGPLKRIVLGRWLAKHPGVGVSGFMQNLEKFGWHGPINEMLEERVGEVLRAGAGIQAYVPPTADQIAAELIAFSVPGAPGFIAEAAGRWKAPRAEETDAARAVAKAEMLKTIGKTLAETKLGENSPEAAEDLIKTMADGEETQTFYQSARSFKEYFEDKKMDPRAVAGRILGDPKAYDDAVATGGDFAVPAHRYFATIAPTEHATFFQDEIRVGDPGEMNGREAKEVTKQVKQRAAAKPEAITEEPEGFEAEAQQVKALVAEQLEEAGFTSRDANLQAEVYSARARRRALDRGETPLKVFQDLGLSIKRIRAGETGPAVTVQPTAEPVVEAPPAQPDIAFEAPAAVPDAVKEAAPTEVVATVPGGEAIVEASRVAEFSTADIKLDPERLQYKILRSETGETGTLKSVRKWDPNLAGILALWRDPADGKIYVVNGHNRLGLAKELGVDKIAGMLIDAKDAKEARMIGALINIAEGHGTAVDAAKLFRDFELTPADLEKQGISLRAKLATDGLALANLDPAIFSAVATGKIPIDRGVAVGAANLNPDQQRKLIELIDRMSKRKNITQDVVKELVAMVGAAPTVEATGFDLFGASAEQESLALERAQVTSSMRQRLSREKKLFGLVGKTRAAAELSRAGNIIEVAQSAKLAAQAERLLEIFDAVKNLSGPISDTINAAAKKIKGGENADKAIAAAYRTVVRELPKEIAGKGRPSEPSAGAPEIGSEAEQPAPGVGVPEPSVELVPADIRTAFKPTYSKKADFDSALIDMAVERFGTTDNPHDAAFMLPDGKMLLGDAEKIDLGDEIKKALGVKKKANVIAEFQRKAGAIRILKGGLEISANFVPTRFQAMALVATHNVFADDKPLRVTVQDPTGAATKSVDIAIPSIDQIVDTFTAMEFFQDEKRGSFAFGPEGMNIKLFAKMDRSTFLHETGHLWMREIQIDEGFIKAKPNLTPSQKQFLVDIQTIREYLGAESLDKLTIEQQEVWARSAEAYFLEGKAPTLGLRAAFARFRAWLTRIYRSIKGLDVQLTPEVREVMDRLLATEDEIAAAKAEQAQAPLITDAQSVMLPAKAAEYLAAVAEANQAAEDAILGPMMAELRMRRTKEFKAAQETIRKAVEAELNASPLYRALSALKNQTFPDGTPMPEGAITPGAEFKISRPAAVAATSESLVALVEKKYPGIFSDPGVFTEGSHPDEIAEMFEFNSGKELLDAAATTIRHETALDRMVEERMRSAHPELFPTPTKEDAVNAIHTEKRARVIQLELEHFASQTPGALKDIVRVLAKPVGIRAAVLEAKKQAAKIIGRQPVQSIRPSQYRRAETRAAREAGNAFAKQDAKAIIDAKLNELVNHELYRAAVEARNNVRDSIKEFRVFQKADEDLAKTRDIDFVNAARVVLSKFKIGTERMEKTAEEYLEQLSKYDPDGYKIALDRIRSATANAQDYLLATYGEFVEMKDVVDGLWAQASAAKQFTLNEKQEKLEDVLGALSRQMFDINNPATKDKYLAAFDKWFNASPRLLGWKALLSQTESWAIAMDAGNAARPFWHSVYIPISEAASKYRLAYDEQTAKLAEIVSKARWEGNVRGKAIAAQELPRTPGLFEGFKDKAEMLGAILHSGNESSLTKLLRGYRWGDYNEEGNLDTSRWDAFFRGTITRGEITKEDMDGIQAIWDQAEALLPTTQRVFKQVYGFFFGELEHKPIQTPWGTYKGGYAPAIIDYVKTPDAAVREDDELDGESVQFVMPSTGRGFTRRRTGAFYPLKLDITLIASHFERVTRFIHLQPAVKDVNKVMWDRGFMQDLQRHDPIIRTGMILPWLERAAHQKLITPSKNRDLDRFFITMRRRSGMSFMFANAKVALVQYTGFIMGTAKVKPRHLRNALASYVSNPGGYVTDLLGKSEFMRTAVATRTMELRNQVDDIFKSENVFKRVEDWATKHGSFLAQATQRHVSFTVWGGAYEQAKEAGETDSEAVRIADSAVRQTQGSFNPEDVTAFETGTPLMRTLTMFYRFYSTALNLQGAEFIKTTREQGLPKGLGRLMYVHSLYLLSAAVIEEVVRRALTATPPDDDEEKYLTDALKVAFAAEAEGVASLAPFGPTIVSVANLKSIFKEGRGYYDDRASISPVAGALDASTQGIGAMQDLIVQGEPMTGRDVRNFMTALNMLTGLPTAALAKPIAFGLDVSTGKKKPKSVFETAKGYVTGQ